MRIDIFSVNPLTVVDFGAKNNIFLAATKSVRGAGPDSARVLAHCCIGARAPMQRHTGGTPSNIYIFVCLIWDTHRYWVKAVVMIYTDIV